MNSASGSGQTLADREPGDLTQAIRELRAEQAALDADISGIKDILGTLLVAINPLDGGPFDNMVAFPASGEYKPGSNEVRSINDRRLGVAGSIDEIRDILHDQAIMLRSILPIIIEARQRIERAV